MRYANVMATLAMFIALGGSSYAAVALSTNSVKSRHIASGQVKRTDLASNAVNTTKIADGSLVAADFKPGELASGSTGSQGPAGPQGPEGPKGPKGDPGMSGFQTLDEVSDFDSSATRYAEVSCPAGKRVVSVSGQLSAPDGLVMLTGEWLMDVDTAAVRAAEVGAGTAQSWYVVAHVTCASVQ